MVKAVFTTKESSNYDDIPWDRYNFPRPYLNQVEKALGSFAIYYEPRRTSSDLSSRGGRSSYFAMCEVTDIQKDDSKPDHFYAIVKNYLRFEKPVPFRDGDYYYEQILQKEDGSTNQGAFGRSVRQLSEIEFDQIVRKGFSKSLTFENSKSPNTPGLDDIQTDFERPIISTIVSRPFRSRTFALQIQEAYDNRCAVTGLKLTNGGGRPEIEAAHIKPVSEKGPDTIQNGIALSRTAHWMFDRGLISFSDDLDILQSKTYPLDDVKRLINADGRLILPANPALRPHPAFLNYHRKSVFKE